MTAAFRSARANQFVALLRPDSSTTGEHPRRPGCAETEWHRSIPRIIARPANDGGVAVGGQRDRHALACVSHSASSDELLALLGPDTTAAGEHPCRPSPAVVAPPAHNGGVTVRGERNRHALACVSRSAGPDQLFALLRPDTTAAGEHPHRLGPPSSHDGGVSVRGQRDGHSLARRQWRFARPIHAGAHQLVALLCPTTSAAREHPRRPCRSIVARPAYNGSVAVG